MYKRLSSSGHEIVWSPNDEELAKQALENTSGTGVPDHANVPDDAPVEVDNPTAKAVRKEYQRLHVEKHGEDSPFYDQSRR